MPKAKETTASLKAEIARLESELGQHRTLVHQWQTAKTASDNALKESRVHFADLKERLADSESNLARLSGYIDRVREDDNARDGFDVVDQHRELVVPRRKPAAAMQASSLEGVTVTDRANGQRRRHWTDY